MTIPDADRLLELIVQYGTARLQVGYLNARSATPHDPDQESVETMREIVSIVYRLYRERGDG